MRAVIIVNIIALLFLVIPYAILGNADIDDAIKTEVRLHYLVSFRLCVIGAACCIEACVLGFASWALHAASKHVLSLCSVIPAIWI